MRWPPAPAQPSALQCPGGAPTACPSPPLQALGLVVLGLVALVALGAVPRSRSSCRWAPVQDLSQAVPAARGRAVMGGSEAGRQLWLPGLGI